MEENEAYDMQVDTNAYLLFLILILLIMGSQNTFDNYFNLLSTQINGINTFFSSFTTTAEGMRVLFQNDKIPNDFKLF